MKEVKHHTADRDIQVILGTLLRTGVIISMVVALTGGIMYLFEQSGTRVYYEHFDRTEAFFTSIPAVLKGVASFKSTAIIQLGILLLIFTPILRIVFSIFSFILEKDYLYVVIGLIVLGIIMVSLNGGFTH